MLLSVIIPAFNEENRIPIYLDEILAFCTKQPWDFEVLVVDDGSQDKTLEVVEKYAHKNPSVRLISYGKNQGKGYAVRKGMLAAQGDICGFTDADGASPMEEINRLLPHFEQGAQVVIGSRAKTSEETNVDNLWYRMVMGRTFNFLINLFVRAKDREGKTILDTQCGFKWFSKKATQEIFSNLKLQGFAFDVEALYLANRFHLPIVEQPINWMEKEGSRVNVLTDPLKMLGQVMKIKWIHRK